MNEREVARQAVHLSGVVVVFIAVTVGEFPTGLGALIVASFVSFLSWWTRRKGMFRKKLPFRVREIEEVEDKTHEMLNSLEREEFLEGRPYFGAFMFFLAIGLVLLIFPLQAAILSIAIISVSDATATLVGVHLGEHKIFYNKEKSVEGSISFFMASFLIAMVLLSPTKALALALLTTLVESLPKVNDNFSVPISVGLFFLII